MKHNISINLIELCLGRLCRWMDEYEFAALAKTVKMPADLVAIDPSLFYISASDLLEKEIVRLSRITDTVPQKILDDSVRTWQFVSLLDVFRSEKDNQQKLIDADFLWKRFNYTSRWNRFLVRPGYVSLVSVDEADYLFNCFSEFMENEKLIYSCRYHRW